MKKLLSKLKSAFLSQDDKVTKEIEKFEEEKRKLELDDPKKKQEIQLNMNTGAIVYPDDITPEQREELEAAIKELKESLSGPGVFDSFEAFLKENSTSGEGFQIPFITVNNLDDGFLQVSTEMQNHKQDTEHWDDEKFLENLYSFYNQGYEMNGLEQIIDKYDSSEELSQDDKKSVRELYLLASMDLVYDV